MVESTLSDLDRLEKVLKEANGRERADGHLPLVRREADVENIAGDLLASFFDMSYFGVFSVPVVHADELKKPPVLAKVVPPLNNAILNSLALREAILYMLDTERTDAQRYAQTEEEIKDPMRYFLLQLLAIYIPIINNVMAELPEQVHPDDLSLRRIFKKRMELTLRRFLVALQNLKTVDQLEDGVSFMAGLADRYGDLFAPWKRGGGATVEEIFLDSDDDDSFADPEDFSDDDADFMDVEENFQARMNRRMEKLFGVNGGKKGGDTTPRGSRRRAPEDLPDMPTGELCNCMNYIANLLKKVDKSYAAAVILIPFIDIALIVIELQGVYYAMKFSSMKAGSVAKAEQERVTQDVYIGPHSFEYKDGTEKSRVDGNMDIYDINQKAFMTVEAMDCVKLMNLAHVSKHDTELVTLFQTESELNKWYYWPAKVFSPSLSANGPHSNSLKRGAETATSHIVHHLAPGYFSSVGALASALAVLQQTSTIGDPNLFHAALLYVCISSLRSWIAVIGHFFGRTLSADNSNLPMAIQDVVASFEAEIKNKLEKQALSTGANGGKYYPTKTIAAFKKLPELADFYAKIKSGGKGDIDTDDFFQTIYGGGFVIFQTKDGLFQQMDTEVTQLMRGKGRYANFHLAGVETSIISKFITAYDRMNQARNPPKTLADKFDTKYQTIHTGTILYDTLKLFGALGVGYAFDVHIGLLSSFPSTCAMVMAPLLVSKAPAAIFNALLMTLAVGELASKVNPLGMASSVAGYMPTGVNGFVFHEAMANVNFMRPVRYALYALATAQFLHKFGVISGLITVSNDGRKEQAGILNQMWNEVKNWLYGLIPSWMVNPYTFLHRKYPVTGYLFDVALKVGGSVLAHSVVRYLASSTSGYFDPFLSFTFLLAALGNRNDELLKQLLFNTVLTVSERFYGGNEGGGQLRLRTLSAPTEVLALPPPPEKSMPQKEEEPSAAEPSSAWEEAAADAALSNAEFERLISRFLEKASPGGAERARHVFEELRLACTDVASDIGEYIASGDEKFLPKKTSVPPSYARVTTALTALLNTVSEPIPGQRLYQTSANSPEEAQPIPLHEQMGAEIIRRTQQTLHQLFPELSTSEEPVVSFEGKKGKEGKGQRNAKRKAKRKADKELAKKGNTKKEEEESFVAKTATRLATRTLDAVKGLSNTKALVLGLLSSAVTATRATTGVLFNTWHKEVIFNDKDKVNMTLLGPLGGTTPFEAYKEASASVLNPAKKFIDKVDGFRQYLPNIPNWNQDQYAFFDKTGDEALDRLLTTDFNRNTTAKNIAAQEYAKGKTWETLTKAFVNIVNRVSDFLARGAEPNAPPKPETKSDPPPVAHKDNVGPSKSWYEWGTELSRKDVGNFLRGVGLAMGGAAEAAHPSMFAHALLTTCFDISLFDYFAKTTRAQLLGDRVELNKRAVVRIAMIAVPILLDLYCSCVTDKSWLSNHERFYFAVTAGVELFADIQMWRFRRVHGTRAARIDEIFNRSTTGGMAMYSLIQIQRSLPAAMLVSVRDSNALTTSFVGHAGAATILTIFTSVATAAVHEKLKLNGRMKSLDKGRKRHAVLRAVLFSTPVILPLLPILLANPNAFHDILVATLATVLMNSDTDTFMGGPLAPRLLAIAAVFYHLHQSLVLGALEDPLNALRLFAGQQFERVAAMLPWNKEVEKAVNDLKFTNAFDESQQTNVTRSQPMPRLLEPQRHHGDNLDPGANELYISSNANTSTSSIYHIFPGTSPAIVNVRSDEEKIKKTSKKKPGEPELAQFSWDRFLSFFTTS